MLAWEMLVYQVIGISFSAAGLILPLLGFCGLLYLLKRTRQVREAGLQRVRSTLGMILGRLASSGGVAGHATGDKPRSEADSVVATSRRTVIAPFGWFEWLLIAAIAFELLRVFFRAWLLPMEAYDAVANWGLKAKAIFLAREIPKDFLRNPHYQVFHPDYPLLVPLLESYVYRSAGNLSEASAKLVFPLFLTGSLGVLVTSLRRAGQSWQSCLLSCFLLVSIPYFSEQATNGYADVVVSFYFGAGSFYLYLWQTRDNRLFLAISALLTGFAGLTKNEGLVLSGIHLLWLAAALLSGAPVTRRSRLASFGIYLCILTAVLLPWYLFTGSLNFRNDVINKEAFIAGLDGKILSRIGPILYHFQTQVFGPKNWNLVWLLFLAAVVLRWKILSRPPAVFLLLAVGMTLAAYTSVYLITPYTVPPYDVTWHLRTSASRLLLHVLPQVVFLAALAFGEAEDRRT